MELETLKAAIAKRDGSHPNEESYYDARDDAHDIADAMTPYLIEIAQAALKLERNRTLFTTNEGWLGDRQDLSMAVERFALAAMSKGKSNQ